MKPVLLIHSPFEGKSFLKSRRPFPIGLLHIASYLQKKNIKAGVLDLCYKPTKHKIERPKQMKVKQNFYLRFGWNDEQIEIWLRKNLDRYHNVVGVSSLMSSTYNGGYRVMEIIKKINPQIKIIVGGPHATAFPYHVASNSVADYICIGEGEEVFYKFLMGDKKVNGIYRTKNIIGEDIKFDKQFIQELDKLPFLNKKLLINNSVLDEMYVIFSRGCPQNCSFCGSHLIQGRQWRHKSAMRALEEIDFYVKEWGIKNFIVEDDNLSPGRNGIEWLKEICMGIISKPYKLKLRVSHGIPVNATSDKELCELMWQAGFRKMTFPVESTDTNVLKDMHKTYVLNYWKKSVKNWKHEKNHPVQIIFGYPFVQTIRTMLKTMVDITNEKCIIWASYFRLNKGTELFDRCIQAKYTTKDFDPINTQSAFLQTERFTVKDIAELLNISKGLNFGTQSGYNVLNDNVNSKIKFGNHYKFIGMPKSIGSVVAKGSFGFAKGQKTFTRLLMMRCGLIGKAKLTVTKNTIIYNGLEKNKMYDILASIIGMKPKGWSW